MPSLLTLNYFKEKGFSRQVNLFSNNNNIGSVGAGTTSEQATNGKENSTASTTQAASEQKTHTKHNNRGLQLIIDSESAIDRLYGGYYSDWISGGQWNRMCSYVLNLSKACRENNIHIVVALRGGLEKQHNDMLFKANRDFKERLGRVMLHLQNRGTPPPKVWWISPTGLRDVMALAFHNQGQYEYYYYCYV